MTDSERRGRFLIARLKPEKKYWFRLVRPDGGGISAVYEIARAEVSS